MSRTNGFEYWVWVYLRMGEVTIVDFAHRRDGRPVGSERVVRLDPAAVGKAIHLHAVPALPFTTEGIGSRHGDEPFRMDIASADAVGAPNPGNLYRTSAHVSVQSDGNEARFSGDGPTLSELDSSKYIHLDDRLSPKSPPHYDPIGPFGPNPFWVAPWRDAEMLGHSVLTVLGLAGPPIGKGMMPSVFDPLEPKRRTALHRAARDGDIDALSPKESRSRRKIDPVDTAGVTPLMLASENGHVAAVERLLELGANPGARDDRGRSPLHYAARVGCHEAVARLLEAGADPSARDRFGDTPLHLAAAGGFLESIERLLDSGADPNAADATYLSTPLHLAARGNYVEVVAPLIDAGARMDTPNEAGRTPLHVAAAYGHVEMAGALIRLGADLNYRDHWGETPLHRPVFFQHKETIDLLIEQGASVTAEDEDGNTPLHIAGSMNRDAAARLLVNAGADVEARNREGLTALDLAIVNRHGIGWGEHNAEVAEVLLDYGATIDPERIPVGDRHALWPHLTPQKLLWDNGDIDYAKLPEIPKDIRRRLSKRDFEGDPTMSEVMRSTTLLHDAARKDMAGLVETLLQNGVSVMTAVRAYETPLHSVARYGTCEMAALLLDRGADLEMPSCNARDERYDPSHEGLRRLWGTPLDAAVRYSRPEMARFLLDRGAKPYGPDERSTDRMLSSQSHAEAEPGPRSKSTLARLWGWLSMGLPISNDPARYTNEQIKRSMKSWWKELMHEQSKFLSDYMKMEPRALACHLSRSLEVVSVLSHDGDRAVAFVRIPSADPDSPSDIERVECFYRNGQWEFESASDGQSPVEPDTLAR